MSYMEEAAEFAIEALQEHKDDIAESLKDGDDLKVTNSMTTYMDESMDGSNTNIYMDLEDAAEILKELREYEESDTGLFGSQTPEEQIKSKAFYTWKNAAYAYLEKALKDIQNKLEEMVSELEGQLEMPGFGTITTARGLMYDVFRSVGVTESLTDEFMKEFVDLAIGRIEE